MNLSHLILSNADFGFGRSMISYFSKNVGILESNFREEIWIICGQLQDVKNYRLGE